MTTRDEFDDLDGWGGASGELRLRRLPSPGIAAVLAVFFPGLGHVYAGRLVAGALWFGVVSFGYWAVVVPGLLLHALCVYCAYRVVDDDGRG